MRALPYGSCSLPAKRPNVNTRGRRRRGLIGAGWSAACSCGRASGCADPGGLVHSQMVLSAALGFSSGRQLAMSRRESSACSGEPTIDVRQLLADSCRPLGQGGLGLLTRPQMFAPLLACRVPSTS